MCVALVSLLFPMLCFGYCLSGIFTIVSLSLTFQFEYSDIIFCLSFGVKPFASTTINIYSRDHLKCGHLLTNLTQYY